MTPGLFYYIGHSVYHLAPCTGCLGHSCRGCVQGRVVWPWSTIILCCRSRASATLGSAPLYSGQFSQASCDPCCGSSAVVAVTSDGRASILWVTWYSVNASSRIHHYINHHHLRTCICGVWSAPSLRTFGFRLRADWYNWSGSLRCLSLLSADRLLRWSYRVDRIVLIDFVLRQFITFLIYFLFNIFLLSWFINQIGQKKSKLLPAYSLESDRKYGSEYILW